MTAIPSRPNGRGIERPAEPANDQSFEGQIREFVRRDVTPARRAKAEEASPAPVPAGDQSAEHMNALLRRISGSAMEEIDRVILELQGVREMLHREAERVSREIAGYASLSHASITSMQVIADSLAQWKNGAQLHPGEKR
ncbi:MAG: hypothetical protein JOZ70_01875 [Pseudolabrys sp.]|nr:hypothetical protein [Pseudolabrys sp.]MBV9953974.1 hypothetical protein [Pseudolabrys sp.]